MEWKTTSALNKSVVVVMLLSTLALAVTFFYWIFSVASGEYISIFRIPWTGVFWGLSLACQGILKLKEHRSHAIFNFIIAAIFSLVRYQTLYLMHSRGHNGFWL